MPVLRKQETTLLHKNILSSSPASTVLQRSYHLLQNSSWFLYACTWRIKSLCFKTFIYLRSYLYLEIQRPCLRILDGFIFKVFPRSFLALTSRISEALQFRNWREESAPIGQIVCEPARRSFISTTLWFLVGRVFLWPEEFTDFPRSLNETQDIQVMQELDAIKHDEKMPALHCLGNKLGKETIGRRGTVCQAGIKAWQRTETIPHNMLLGLQSSL